MGDSKGSEVWVWFSTGSKTPFSQECQRLACPRLGQSFGGLCEKSYLVVQIQGADPGASASARGAFRATGSDKLLGLVALED